MEQYHLLQSLIDLAEAVGVEIRRAPSAGEGGDHPGGALVRLRGKELLFLDPTATLSDQIDVTASALRGRKELDDIFLPPEVRQAIEK